MGIPENLRHTVTKSANADEHYISYRHILRHTNVTERHREVNIMTEQEERSYIKTLYSKIYLLIEKYNYKKMTDRDWDNLIQEAGELQRQFKQCGEVWYLCRGMLRDYLSYKEMKEKGKMPDGCKKKEDQ